MPHVDFDQVLAEVLVADPRYHRDVYHFVREALDFTQDQLQRRGELLPRPELGHHVTCQELLGGIREFALKEFGPMTLTVLNEWGVHGCEDFGEIVFNMIEHKIFSKTEKDNRDDFKKAGFSFDEAFRRPFLPANGTPTCARSEIDRG